MSILINGMGFPTKENFMTQLYLICDKDGDWYAVDTTNKDLYKLIEVKEPHGRLIAEKTITEIRYHDADGYHIVNGEQLCELEIDANIVIEAEGETE